jgi:hypothetical protein
MNVVLRWFTRILIIVVVVAIELTATAIVYGRVSEWRLAAATRIDTLNGIESLEEPELYQEILINKVLPETIRGQGP